MAIARTAGEAAAICLALLSLLGCVGLPRNDQLIASSGTGIYRTNDAVCTSHWRPILQDREPDSAPDPFLDPRGFSLMTWNVYKAQLEGWSEDFLRLSAGQDLILLQEAHLTPSFRSVLNRSHYHWTMARAFDFKGAETGVLTAGSVKPLATCLERIPEPLIRAPKSILLTIYPLQDRSEELWVANVHGVNFTLETAQFQRQLEALADVLAPHRGPLIVAGDFNNWSRPRSDILSTIAERLQLEPLSLRNDLRSRHWGYPVDLVFFRGVEVLEADTVEVQTSDHNPVRVKFAVP